MLVAEDRLDGFQAERCAAAINQSLEYLFRLPADLEQQVAGFIRLACASDWTWKSKSGAGLLISIRISKSNTAAPASTW
jgi:hypothetical protein